jgi:hypothetical protein
LATIGAGGTCDRLDTDADYYLATARVPLNTFASDTITTGP